MSWKGIKAKLKWWIWPDPYITDHEFTKVTWMNLCGYLPDSQSVRCQKARWAHVKDGRNR